MVFSIFFLTKHCEVNHATKGGYQHPYYCNREP